MRRMSFSVRVLLSAVVLASSLSLVGCNDKAAQERDEWKAKAEALEKRVAELEAQQGGVVSQEKTGMVVAANTPQSFTDIDAKVPTADMIGELAKLRVFEGVGNEFKPYEPITRSDYIIWLYHAYNAMHGVDKQIRMAPTFKVPFSDISSSDPAFPYVQAFAASGFSVGYDDKTFKPTQPLTREEMIGLKNGVDGNDLYPAGPTGFSDDAQIDKRYKSAVYTENVVRNGVSAGPRGNNIFRAFGALKTFKPKEPVLRYEAAATLWQTDHRGGATAAKALKPDGN